MKTAYRILIVFLTISLFCCSAPQTVSVKVPRGYDSLYNRYDSVSVRVVRDSTGRVVDSVRVQTGFLRSAQTQRKGTWLIIGSVLLTLIILFIKENN